MSDAPPTAPGPSDEEIVGLIAEHTINVLQAICSAGVDAGRAVACASQALVQLDILAAEQQADRGRLASPHHTSALVAVEQLRRCLAPMRVRTIERIEGFSLLEQFGQALDALQASVLAHWEAQNVEAQAPPLRLIMPNGSDHTVGGAG